MRPIRIIPTGSIFSLIEGTALGPSGEGPAILRTMSLRPDFLAAIVAALPLHFSDGALSVAQHEMIASWVSALTRCHY